MNTKNILFIDIDGVLNCLSTKERSPDGFIGVDPRKVHILKEMADAIDADIVLSSSWKSEWSKDPEKCTGDGKYLVECLQAEGLSILDKIEDPPGRHGKARRGEAIINWLLTHEHGAWIVLDDEEFDFVRTKVTRHLLRTSYQWGLKEKHLEVAERMIRDQLAHPEMYPLIQTSSNNDSDAAVDRSAHYGREL